MRTTYNKIVNFDEETNEVTILEESFESENGLRGVTGSVYDIISKEDYQKQINEYLGNPQAISEYWEDNVGTFLSYDSMIDISNDEEEIARVILGIDCNEDHLDLIRKDLNLSENDCFTINLSSCGRIFNSKYKGNMNPELGDIIKEFVS